MAHICTDAGHGGPDSGAVWQSIQEKDLNLIYCGQLNAELKARGHHVLTTRLGDDDAPPLGIRCKLVNAHHRLQRPAFDCIVSLHCNVAAKVDPANGGYRALPQVRGFYAIYSQESPQSTALARSIAQKVEEAGVILKHGGMLSTVELGRTLAWIHKTLPPAVLLEMGFMTNPEELALLQNSDYQRKLIGAIADGLETFLSKQSTPQEVHHG
ncbi:MAG: hypothetical protein D6715_05190 [Calditrichaeota bacterium]|nr:MAG: hypothetical protein D6715_05190 [Calditrichota bacterium]